MRQNLSADKQVMTPGKIMHVKFWQKQYATFHKVANDDLEHWPFSSDWGQVQGMHVTHLD